MCSECIFAASAALHNSCTALLLPPPLLAAELPGTRLHRAPLPLCHPLLPCRGLILFFAIFLVRTFSQLNARAPAHTLLQRRRRRDGCFLALLQLRPRVPSLVAIAIVAAAIAAAVAVAVAVVAAVAPTPALVRPWIFASARLHLGAFFVAEFG